MFEYPARNYHSLSQKLTSVLEEIGVSEPTLLIRRCAMLLGETITNLADSINENKSTYHIFGSQSEGSTVVGLDSDTDNFFYNNIVCVIQGYHEWVENPNLHQLLMIQDEKIAPGYCMLQPVYSNICRAFTEVTDRESQTYWDGKVVLKNNLNNYVWHLGEGFVRNGPAKTLHIKEGIDQDYIYAYQIKTLPNFVSTWLQQQLQKRRLTQDMKSYIESHPCYVVPVGSTRGSPTEHLEWRISTAHAERCVMFNLNITQIQCYVMIKLILKSYLQHPEVKGLSTFMCKNILLLCIEDTEPEDWCAHNLLSLFQFSLLQLKHCVSEEYCPHFIMNENNLMAGKFTPEIKDWLLEKIENLYQTKGSAFLDIKIDRVCCRLLNSINCNKGLFVSRIPSHVLYKCCYTDDGMTIFKSILVDCVASVAQGVHSNIVTLFQKTKLKENKFETVMTPVLELFRTKKSLETEAANLLRLPILSSLGSAKASQDIQHRQLVSSEAKKWLYDGLDSDVASSRLKLASVYYCLGNFNMAEYFLQITEDKYDLNTVMTMCGCTSLPSRLRIRNSAQKYYELCQHTIKSDIYYYVYTYIIHNHVAFSVSFNGDEVYSQPKELQYEMFRSSKHDIALRSDEDFWMDWAIVDSLPFLYFLQYKTFGHLKKHTYQQQALNKLVNSITRDDLWHRETALNLLGQCMVQEKRYDEAYHYFIKSLQLRQTNNAAALHICIMLCSLLSQNTCS